MMRGPLHLLVTTWLDEADASAHTAHSWLVTSLAEIVSGVSGALGVVVETLTDFTMLVPFPNDNDGLSADVDVLH
jgi:hypothetical protein